MNVNRWQLRKQRAKARSDNQHRAKARKRMEGPAPEYPPDRPSGRYANILINLPWMPGENTVCLQVDFAELPSRIDQYVLDGEVLNLTELCRIEIRKRLPQIRISAE